MTVLKAIGLMSGTSMDGVDVALIETDGESFVRRGAFASYAYSAEDRSLLRRALEDALTIEQRDQRPGAVADAEACITRRHVEAVRAFLSSHALAASTIDVLGFHGQTVLHRPERRLTVQIGDGEQLAAATGIRTAYDLRAADVAACGQGAPLVPVYHRALINASQIEGPVALVNIGGVANITYCSDRNCDPVAFDTGPGNALIDDLMLERTGVAMDRDGACAASGQADELVLRQMLAHPYFARPLPKSLDRNDFSRAAIASLATADAAATLTAFTALSIVAAFDLVSQTPRQLIVCGGGARNRALMARLSETLARLACSVCTADDMGWSADAMEAEAFAFLAVRSLRGLPITFPGTTGVARPLTGGRISAPRVVSPAAE